MLGSFRLFSILGMIAMLALAWFAAGHFREQTSLSLITLSTDSSVATAHHFEAQVWRKYRDILSQGYVSTPFKQDMSAFVNDANIAGVRVYDPRGLLLYTTGGTITSSQFQKFTIDAKASKNKAYSDMTTSTESNIGSPTGQERRMLRSFIVLGKGTTEGYVEIFIDITDEWDKLKMMQWVLVGGMAFVFLLLIGLLSIIYSKAETLIAVQHERNIELEQKARFAEEETKQKTQFLANISHELRTPLNAIIGFSDILKTEYSEQVEDPTMKGYIKDIHSSGVHLLALINDILDFSKAEAGKLELEVEDINATKTALSCLRLVSPRAEAASIELVNNFPKEHFVLETDGKKFKQVLLNLLSNAVKFTPTGGQVKLTGWLDLASDSYIFQVTDTGIGMEQKDIAKALSAFGQVDNKLSKQYEGTGLGLPLTRKFVELMGGKFTMQSEQNVGTTVTFSLPRKFRQVEGVIVKRIS